MASTAKEIRLFERNFSSNSVRGLSWRFPSLAKLITSSGGRLIWGLLLQNRGKIKILILHITRALSQLIWDSTLVLF